MLDQLLERLGIGRALREAVAGRRLDPELVERVCFAFVVQRALEPGSKLATTRGTRERVAIEGCPAFSDDAAFRAMDFVLAALPEIAKGFFATLKEELLYRGVWPTLDTARRTIFEYVEVFYNRQRVHSSLDNLKPVDYETRRRNLDEEQAA